MKKLSIILAILMIAMFALFAMSSGENTESSSDQGNDEVQENVENNDSIGNYSVVIDSCRLAKDYEGKDVVIVKYIFSNISSDDSVAFLYTFDCTVYQAGVGLNEAYVLDDSANYTSDNQTKEIKKGASLDVEVAYELNDITTDIEVEVEETFSFSDKVITKTFTLGQ